MSDRPLNEELMRTEAQLRNLHPSEPSWSRDQLMYEAGRQAGQQRRSSRFWIATSSVLSVALLAMTGVVWMQSIHSQSDPQLPSAATDFDFGSSARAANDSGEAPKNSQTFAYLRLRHSAVRGDDTSRPERRSEIRRDVPPPISNQRQMIHELLHNS